MVYTPGGRGSRKLPSVAEVTSPTRVLSASSTWSAAAYGSMQGEARVDPSQVGPRWTIPSMPESIALADGADVSGGSRIAWQPARETASTTTSSPPRDERE